MPGTCWGSCNTGAYACGSGCGGTDGRTLVSLDTKLQHTVDRIKTSQDFCMRSHLYVGDVAFSGEVPARNVSDTRQGKTRIHPIGLVQLRPNHVVQIRDLIVFANKSGS